MKPPIIIKILIKAIIPPIIAMFILSKWNFCEYITFIPEDHCFESGLALYLAILEAIVELVEYFILKDKATIACIFYTNEQREDSSTTPIVQMSAKSMGVTNIWCHIILRGNYRKLVGTEICLDIPPWFSAQLDATSSLQQENRQIKWNVSALLPEHDNKKEIHTETRIKISLIRNNANNASIDLQPTVKKKRGLKFITNGMTIHNEGE